MSYPAYPYLSPVVGHFWMFKRWVLEHHAATGTWPTYIDGDAAQTLTIPYSSTGYAGAASTTITGPVFIAGVRPNPDFTYSPRYNEYYSGHCYIQVTGSNGTYVDGAECVAREFLIGPEIYTAQYNQYPGDSTALDKRRGYIVDPVSVTIKTYHTYSTGSVENNTVVISYIKLTYK